MKLDQYIRGLSPGQLKSYASRCGTTSRYLKSHILYATKEPRKALRDALWVQSRGEVTQLDVLEHFGITQTGVR